MTRPEPEQSRLSFLLAGQLTKSTESINISVFFHVIYAEDGRGKLSEDALDTQLDALNRAFIDTRFTFVDAKVEDAENRPSRFTENSRWHYMEADSSAEAEAKANLHRGLPNDLNVYFVEPRTDLGWAAMPWTPDARSYKDGVVIHYSTVPGGGRKHYDEGDTLVHEVGHWLGLWHTFERGCPPPGDVVADTAPEATQSAGCNRSRDTCPGDGLNDPVENYMDYSYDACMVEFTPAQRERMTHEFFVYRSPVPHAVLRVLNALEAVAF